MKTTLFTIQAKASHHEKAITGLVGKKKEAMEKIMLAARSAICSNALTFGAIRSEDKLRGKDLYLAWKFANASKADWTQEGEDVARREQGQLFSAINEAKQAVLHCGTLDSVRAVGWGKDRDTDTYVAATHEVAKDSPLGHLMHGLRAQAVLVAHDQLLKGKMPRAIMRPCHSNKDKENKVIPGIIDYNGQWVKYDLFLARKLLSVMGAAGVNDLDVLQVIKRLDAFRSQNNKSVKDSAPLQLAAPSEIKIKRTRKEKVAA
jgi:hypothetical protein